MLELDNLKNFALFLSKVLGASTEVLLHDIHTGRIVWINNGWISNREEGQLYDTKGIIQLAEEAKNNGNKHMQVGYKSTLYLKGLATDTGGRSLRSSNLFIYDDDDELRYVICVNTDVSPVEQFQISVQNLLDVTGMNIVNAPVGYVPDIDRDANIESLTMHVILEEIERAKPFSTDSKEAKMQILKRLNDKGVFEVRYIIPKVCELLDIAQATLYKYLKEIKRAESEEEPETGAASEADMAANS